MTKHISLEDIYNDTMQKQAGYVQMSEAMKEAEAEEALNKMAFAAGYDWLMAQQEQEKQAAAYLGELYAEAMTRGFYKAAELDGVTIKNDMPTSNNGVVPSKPQATVPVAPAAPSKEGWNFLQANLPKKTVGNVFTPQNATAQPKQVWASNANQPITTKQ